MFTPVRALSQFVSQFGTELGMVAAGCIISMLPITILYFILQKQFMSGSVAGAVKG
jgi:ABC-type glycerol-3-phosphate transport system permease component